jgi:hypothetical protein
MIFTIILQNLYKTFLKVSMPRKKLKTFFFVTFPKLGILMEKVAGYRIKKPKKSIHFRSRFAAKGLKMIINACLK